MNEEFISNEKDSIGLEKLGVNELIWARVEGVYIPLKVY